MATKSTTPKSTSELPSVLSFTRAISPGHFLLSSINSAAEKAERTALGVREEPLRGLNATMKSTEEEKSKAVLQVVESSELAPGDDTLVISGKIMVNGAMARIQACNVKTYAGMHQSAIARAVETGIVSELAKRYAINILSGNWGWRNALESESITVRVSWKVQGEQFDVSATDLMMSGVDAFDLAQPEYATHTKAIETLASAIESALLRAKGFGTNFKVEGLFAMGVGARVYPSQEWASQSFKDASKVEWKGGEGVTRVLAKLTKNGASQAIMNDRKIGNALRLIDTWYKDADAGAPIVIEPYGANSHHGYALRASTDSIFAAAKQVGSGAELSTELLSFYTACVIRGGVYGGKEE